MEKIIGIVGEYNPFHNGHLYHINETKRLVGGDAPVVAVMSGDYVQRGEPAIYSKFARAEAAVRSGVDLAVELPLPWCLSSAEAFARGAVGLLSALGVTHLSFGSELGEIEPLDTLARSLLDPTLTYTIKEKLKTNANMSFAQARQSALQEKLGDSAKLLEMPNNILGVEYIKAIYELGLSSTPLTVTRKGNGHDSHGGGELKSASEIRRMILDGTDVSADVPDAALQVYRREEEQGRCAVETRSLEQAILSRLRMADETVFDMLPDGADGIGRRLYEAVKTECTVDAVLSAAKTRRYALSRLRRMLICAALGVKNGMNGDIPPYARVLAFNGCGREILSIMKKESVLPVLTKPASVRDLSAECAQMFSLGASAHDMYVLAYKAENERKGTNDWKIGPKIV